MKDARALRNIDTPAVLIDGRVMRRNIARAAALCDAAGVALRPHVKTHKIPQFAKMQMRAGARGITCQTLGEAEAMSAAGLQDILISYNIVGEAKLTRLRRLARKIKSLRVCADSVFVAKGLSSVFAGGKPLQVMAEVDTGGKRTGVCSAQAAAALARAIAGLPGLEFSGLLTYPPPLQVAVANGRLAAARRACERAGLPCPSVSAGGTPDLPAVAEFSAATEYRAGTYIYNDRSMVARGACALSDCAMTVLATVVSSPAPGRAVIDAGSKTLSSDLLGLPDYGEAQGASAIRVSALSEEHGHLTFPRSVRIRPGARLRIIPNHTCVVSNLAEEIALLETSGRISRISVVRARTLNT